MKQTAVEWLLTKIPFDVSLELIKKGITKEAKEMEKQQIIEAHNNGKNILPPNESGQQYYNETFNK